MANTGYKIYLNRRRLILDPSGSIFYNGLTWSSDLTEPNSDILGNPILSGLGPYFPNVYDIATCPISITTTSTTTSTTTIAPGFALSFDTMLPGSFPATQSFDASYNLSPISSVYSSNENTIVLNYGETEVNFTFESFYNTGFDIPTNNSSAKEFLASIFTAPGCTTTVNSYTQGATLLWDVTITGITENKTVTFRETLPIEFVVSQPDLQINNFGIYDGVTYFSDYTVNANNSNSPVQYGIYYNRFLYQMFSTADIFVNCTNTSGASTDCYNSYFDFNVSIPVGTNGYIFGGFNPSYSTTMQISMPGTPP